MAEDFSKMISFALIAYSYSAIAKEFLRKKLLLDQNTNIL